MAMQVGINSTNTNVKATEYKSQLQASSPVWIGLKQVFKTLKDWMLK
jgi:hypothetical protein